MGCSLHNTAGDSQALSQALITKVTFVVESGEITKVKCAGRAKTALGTPELYDIEIIYGNTTQ